MKYSHGKILPDHILYIRVPSLVILIFHMMTISGRTPRSSSIRLDLECLLWVQVFVVAIFHAILIRSCYLEIWLKMTRDGSHDNGYPPVLFQHWPDEWRRNQPGCASVCYNTSYLTISDSLKPTRLVLGFPIASKCLPNVGMLGNMHNISFVPIFWFEECNLFWLKYKKWVSRQLFW